MLNKWRERRRQEKAVRAAIRNDRYLSKLSNSVNGIHSIDYSGEGPFLSIHEVEDILRDKLVGAATQEGYNSGADDE